MSEADPQDEPRSASEERKPGRLLRAFSDRRVQAWERVRELEEQASALPPAADPKQMLEMIEAGDNPWDRTQEFKAARAEARAEAPKARRRAMLLFELPDALMGLAVLAAVAALNSLWLGAVGVDYLGSYLQSGFLIALLFGVVVVAIDLDSHPDLIAAAPRFYLAAILFLFTELEEALGDLFERRRSERELADAGLDWLTPRFRVPMLDLALTRLFLLAFAAATLLWALLVAPLQYWVNLVCGAPAREALASSRTLWVVRSPHRIEYLRGPKDPNDFESDQLKEAHERGEMSEVAFAKRPVAFTQAIAAVFLFGISFLVS